MMIMGDFSLYLAFKNSFVLCTQAHNHKYIQHITAVTRIPVWLWQGKECTADTGEDSNLKEEWRHANF